MPKGEYIRTLKTRRALSAAHTGKKLSPEHVAKIVAANTGQHRTSAFRLKMSSILRGKKRRALTPEHRAKIGARMKGRIISAETRKRISEASIIHPGCNQFDRRLRLAYGITEVYYNELVKNQNNLCAVCSKPETETRRGVKLKHLSVDHDHKTGIVRGLLCSKCNKALGGFKESIALLRRACSYIEEFEHLDYEG